jgi:hypothetical protein
MSRPRLSRPRRVIAVTGIAATAGFASFATATMAGATTSQCAFNGFCYTQEVHGTDLVMSVGNTWGPSSNEKVVVQKQDDHSTASDFLDGLAPFPKTTNAKFFEYAPRGKQSGYCVSEPHSHSGLVLRSCDGSANQAWDAQLSGSSYEWINEATGDAMTDPGKYGSSTGKAGTQITGAHASAAASQLWDAKDN